MKWFKEKVYLKALAPTLMVALLFGVQFLIASRHMELHDLLMNLYYLPLLLAAFYFGLKGAVVFVMVLALLSGLHVFLHSPHLYHSYLLQIFMCCCLGFLMGYLSDIEKATIRSLVHSKIEFQRALSSALDAKDPYTKGHSLRVAQYALAIGKRLDLAAEDCRNLYQAALLHDLGKIGLPDRILKKNGKLSKQEYEAITQHPDIGVAILSKVAVFKKVLPAVRHHHEKFNGSGYPDGMKATDIPLMARIICIADAFDAMTSDRVYHQKKSVEEAISELKRCAGSQFDEDLVVIFVEVLTRRSLESILEHQAEF